MSQPKILVVGDVMVDRYHFGTAVRLSAESPIPIVKITDEKSFMGGAGNVVQNLLDLGAEVKVPGYNPGMILPTKNRLMVGDTQVARWDENDELPPVDLETIDQAVLHWQPDAVVISDYGKGSVTYEVNEVLADLAVPTFIDTKRNPNDFVIFDQAETTFFPNQKEYNEYRARYDAQASVLLKRGPDGMQRLSYGRVEIEWAALANRVVSVCGAGDTVIAAYTYAACTGRKAISFASAAAAVVVQKPGTATATMEEIDEVLKEIKAETAPFV